MWPEKSLRPLRASLRWTIKFTNNKHIFNSLCIHWLFIIIQYNNFQLEILKLDRYSNFTMGSAAKSCSLYCMSEFFHRCIRHFAKILRFRNIIINLTQFLFARSKISNVYKKQFRPKVRSQIYSYSNEPEKITKFPSRWLASDL